MNATFEVPSTATNFGSGPTVQYAKVTMFTDPVFRVYDTLLFVDADSKVQSALRTQLRLAHTLPHDRAIIFRDNGAAFSKGTFYEQELDFKQVSVVARSNFEEEYPDTYLTGSTSFFMVNMTRLLAPIDFDTRAQELLREYRSASCCRRVCVCVRVRCNFRRARACLRQPLSIAL